MSGPDAYHCFSRTGHRRICRSNIMGLTMKISTLMSYAQGYVGATKEIVEMEKAGQQLENVIQMEETLDDRADVKGAFMFVMAFGRTFRAGALNIPVNVFYSSRQGGGIAGINVGFNVTKSKSTIGTGL